MVDRRALVNTSLGEILELPVVDRMLASGVVGGEVAGDTLTLQGAETGSAEVGRIEAESPFELMYSEGNTTPAEQVAMRWRPTFTTIGAYNGGMIQASQDVSYTNAFYIYALLAELGRYRAQISAGFAAFTLFNALPVIENDGNNVNLVQALVLNAAPTHERDSAGTSTTPQSVGVSFSPQSRALVAGAAMNKTAGDKGLVHAPKFSTVAGSSVAFGTTCAVQVQNITFGLFQPGAGTETATAVFGMDVLPLPFGGNITKAAVRSAITPASNAYAFLNTGGAQSDWGGGNHLDCGIVQILADNTSLSLGAAGGDVQINWNGSALEFDPISGDDLRWSFGTNQHTLQSSNFGSGSELLMGFERFAFGQTSAVGNQVGVFVAPARTTQVAGEWADFLLTQSGNLTLDDAMTALNAWVINPISVSAGTGSITGPVNTLNVGGMTTSGIGSNDRSSLRVTGRHWQRGLVQHEPARPAQIVANQAAYAGWGLGNSEREWCIVDSDAARTIQGIDASTQTQDGDTRTFTNDGSFNISFTHQDVAAAAADRIITEDGLTQVVGPDETREFRYDGAFLRWRMRAA